LGWVDGSTPAPEVLTSIMPSIAPDTLHIKIYSGSHVELLNWIVKQGVFGFISIFSIFLFPLYKGITFLRKNEGKHFGCKLALVALPLIISISGLGVQTLNLKMSITFYSFSIATILAVSVSWRGAVKSPCPTMGSPKINDSHEIQRG
jgi:O-antigen ligase